MGGMVGGDGVDGAVYQPAPEGQAVVGRLDGGVAFDKVAQLGIVAVVKPQVVGRHLGGDMFHIERLVAQQRQLGGGAQVGYMQACAVFAGTLDGFVCRNETGLGVAYLGVEGGGLMLRAGKLQLVVTHVGLDDALVLAVRHYQLVALTEELVQRLRLVDQHVTGAAAQEEFDGCVTVDGDAEQFLDIVVGGTQHKAVVDRALLGGDVFFLLQKGERSGLRVGVGHIDDGGHPARQGRTALRGEVGLVGKTGVTEMDVGVDNTGQDIASRRVKHLRLSQPLAVLHQTAFMHEKVPCRHGTFVYYRAVLYDIVHLEFAFARPIPGGHVGVG